MQTQRTNSQTRFAIEEDGSEYELGEDGGSRRGSNHSAFSNTVSSNSSKTRYVWTLCARLSVSSLLLLSLALAIALGIISYLYVNTFDSFETCRTRHCTRTATLFLRTMDDTVDPCENFHKFACGNWITDTATVVSVGTYDHTTIMRDRIIGRLRTLTENISDKDIHSLQQVKRLYKTCVNLEEIQKAGLSPLANLINHIFRPGGSKSPTIAETLGYIRQLTAQSYIFDLAIEPDYTDTSKHAIFIDQPELPVSKTIFSLDSNKKVLEAYERLIVDTTRSIVIEMRKTRNVTSAQKILQMELFKNPETAVKIVIDLEKKFAMGISEGKDRAKPLINNGYTLKHLNRISQGLFQGTNEFDPIETWELKYTGNDEENGTEHFNWIDYFNTLYDGISNKHEFHDGYRVIVNDVKYIKNMAKILLATPKEHLEMYLTWQVIFSFGKDLTREFKQHFTIFDSVIDGSETTPNRFTVCINLIDKSIPFALTHKYVNKYVKDEVIHEAREMLGLIVTAFKSMVAELNWMDENTKKRASLKADKIRAFLGYPRWLRDPVDVDEFHKELNLTNKDFFTNMIRMLSWRSKKTLLKLENEVDKAWSGDDSPAEADAFYDDELNAITFPSGFLQEPFIGMGLRSIDYGALGSVIGHELTHGFDTEGRYSDENGKLNSWWSVDTLQKFQEKASCIEEQYNQFRLPELAKSLGDNNTVNGQRTLAENIADNGGIREALKAYRLYIEKIGKPEPRLPGLERYTNDQLFFLSFAQSWCSYMNPASLLEMVETNEHSPPKFRILGPLMNFGEFSNVWNCKEKSEMNPVKKCVLW